MLQRIKKADVTGATRFYRPPYEGISAIAWFGGALIYVTIARTMDENISVVGYGAIPMLIIAFYRSYQTLQNWYFKTRLTTPLRPMTTVKDVLSKQKASGETFIGKGFDWQPYHARVMKEISTIPMDATLDPPPIFRKIMVWLGLAARNTNLEGKHYIHGCGDGERDLFVSKQSRRSHTMVLGTNGAGKTRMLEALVMQSVARGHVTDAEQHVWMEYKRRYDHATEMTRKGSSGKFEHAKLNFKKWYYEKVLNLLPKREIGPIFILDPKGDIDLRDRAFATAKLFGREKSFYYFSPTDDKMSFRVNPLANYSRRTELANRISALLPSGGDSDAFKQFAWRAINVVIEGLDMAGISINLINLRTYVEGGVESLLIPCVEKHLTIHQDHYKTWRSTIDSLNNRMPKSSSNLDEDSSRRAVALASFYVTNVKPSTEKFPVAHPNTTIDGMIDVMRHDSQHYSKLISNLIPILVQLTTGPMEVLLSKQDQNVADARSATSFRELIENNAIVYVNFESLADSIVGSALGSLFIADLTACAARRHHSGISEPPVSIFIDEAAEMMNDPFIQALNKGRSAGFELTLASQTKADFVARMGNEAKALQVLGNVNTTIAMRLQDTDSIQMVTEKFADTTYEEKTSSKTSTTIAAMAKRGRDFSGSVMKNSQSSDLPLVSGDLLNSLPPGHFFGHLPGGKKVKGRVLMMPLDDSDRFVPTQDGRKPDRHSLSPVDKKAPDGSSSYEQTVSITLDPKPDFYHLSDISHLSLPTEADAQDPALTG